MPLSLHNTRTRTTAEFKPLEEGKVGMYLCGPTVYHYAHIGNLRTYLFGDLLRRVLGLAGYKVRHVMNITDVGHLTSDQDTGEDKMEAGAAREGKTVWEIAAHYTKAFQDDLKALRVMPPSVWCKATDHIPEQVAMVQVLMDKGFGYVIGDGVYFDTSKFPAYGVLAPKNLEGQMAGARVEVSEGKRNPADFALWKFSPKDKRRLMEWDSPWGKGAPGWHIECSAMATKYLGEQFDIHAGAIDLIPVHHTNEIAQAEAATGKSPWVNVWMHGEFLVMDKGRMSKSAGDFLRLTDLVEAGYAPLDYRYLCLGAHYRKPLSFSFASLDQAKAGRSNLMEKMAALAGVKAIPIAEAKSLPAWAAFWSCLEDDLNAPQALAALWDFTREKSLAPEQKAGILKLMDHCLGLDLLMPQEKKAEAPLTTEEQALLDGRQAAKEAKDYAKADALRKELENKGILLEDTPTGPKWKRRP
jgi:cysteinyl-tRNA synthetase